MLKDLYDLCFERGKDFPQFTKKKAARSSRPTRRRWRRSSTKFLPRIPSSSSSTAPGKKTMLGFFVGQVMKASKGQANPQM